MVTMVISRLAWCEASGPQAGENVAAVDVTPDTWWKTAARVGQTTTRPYMGHDLHCAGVVDPVSYRNVRQGHWHGARVGYSEKLLGLVLPAGVRQTSSFRFAEVNCAHAGSVEAGVCVQVPDEQTSVVHGCCRRSPPESTPTRRRHRPNPQCSRTTTAGAALAAASGFASPNEEPVSVEGDLGRVRPSSLSGNVGKIVSLRVVGPVVLVERDLNVTGVALSRHDPAPLPKGTSK